MRLDASDFEAVWQHICTRALVDHEQGTLIESFVKEELAKRGYYIARGQNTYSNSPMTFAELVNTARTWNREGRVDPERAPKEIRILDLLDQTASAKLIAHWGVDYFHLARYDGRWMIVNVLWQTPPR